jgi:hypothetical protein
MAVISVDLASKNYADIGVVVLERAGERIMVEPIRLTPERGFAGRPEAKALADFLAQYAAEIGATTILIDGPQAWKSPNTEAPHSRRCERELWTPGKTGLPCTTKPANYLGFIQFSISLFDLLHAMKWPRLKSIELAPTTDHVAVETFPTAAWRELGLRPLLGKRKSRPEIVAAKLSELCRSFTLDVYPDLTHDELQALVAGLAGLDLVRERQAGYKVAGCEPVEVDGYWREGFIICPTHDVIAEFGRDNAG